MISNPMDTMTYLALKKSGLPKNQIFGMGGALDSARFKCYLSKALKANLERDRGHGDRRSRRHDDDSALFEGYLQRHSGNRTAEQEEVEKVVADTMVGGRR